jgi:polar amino acid transport system substrate-binding protein
LHTVLRAVWSALAFVLVFLSLGARPARAEPTEGAAASPAVAAGAPSSADAATGTLATIRARGALQWGGDQEGGGPFIFPDEEDPEKIVGFEVDVADALSRYLNVKSEFSQGQWDKLLDLLDADKIDLVLNGYERMDDRLASWDASMPYYVYGLQLMLRKNDPTFTSWDSLKANKAKIGVLTGSAAEEHMREFCGDACEVITYDGGTDAIREVETGKVDATLQDTPIARFYGPRFAGLQPVGDPVAPGHYVVYVRKGDTALLQAVNEAIVLMIRSGELERIYRTWDIWDDNQEQLVGLAENARYFGYHAAVSAEVEKVAMPTQEEVQKDVQVRGWEVIKRNGGILLESAGLTVLLSAASFPLAILIGLLVAVGRMYGPAWLRVPLAAYVEVLRGTPIMLQLYFVFFLLPEVGINIPAFACGIIGLAMNYSAYESEIYRAGLQAIPGGQMEAALSLGMSRAQAVRRIVIPQAVRIVIPPVVNDFIALFKDTSVCSVVTIVELTKRFSVLSLSTGATIELMAVTALLYMMMSYPMSVLSRRIEQRLGTTGVMA